jgi:hypothetical protein
MSETAHKTPAAPQTAAPVTAQAAAAPAQNALPGSGIAEVAPMEDFRYMDTPLASRPAFNRTGLPDDLKRGVEALSGVNLDSVKVHFRSPEPARLHAHAYARGNVIHVAPGREHHLPHEAWHLAQQALGRVAPTMQLKSDTPLNDDPALEREADRMGAAALRAGRAGAAGTYARLAPPATPAPLARWPAPAARGVVQRTPEAALDLYKPPSDEVAKLMRMVANAREITQNFPLITSKSATYRSIKNTLRAQIDLVANLVGAGAKKSFISTWNRGIKRDIASYALTRPKEGFDVPKVREEKGFYSGSDTQSYLAKWTTRALTEKSSTADRKLAKVVPLILADAEFPADVKVALKLFFGHTANFKPEDGQGRDFRSVEHGQYYRSSLEPIRSGNSKALKYHAAKFYKKRGGALPKGSTVQVINRTLHGEIIDRGKLPKNIEGVTFINGDQSPGIAAYKSSAGSHTGSLGLIQNVFRTLQTGTEVERRFGKSDPQAWPEEAAGDRFRPVVAEHRLASETELNYHDFLLADRGALVAQVASEIEKGYDDEPGWRVVPIQSPTHASLILQLVGDEGEELLGEKDWRELFIKTFNAAAGENKLRTRATHRGSFGFPYPTISSVGGPVRIWPGLTPPDVFRRLILGTLTRLANNWRFQKPKFGNSGASPKPSLVPNTNVPLYREALKSAVRYAQDAMRETIAVKGPRALVNWVAVRLQRNLTKAQFLLDAKPDEKRDDEQLYLKSALTVENLMEYSYLLESLNAQALSPEKAAAHDPYPGYLGKTLGLASPGIKTTTFYLDSGIQAIVCANLLASNWTLRRKTGKKPDKQAPIETIDLYSYFEYAAIDKTNLHLEPLNRAKEGYLNEEQILELLNERDAEKKPKPAIVSADLNPVLTSLETSASLTRYQTIFSRLAGKPDAKNERTIPIVDVTNASLAEVAALKLQEGYENFIVVESLSKHQQLGADKFTMGRMSAVGTEAFVAMADKLIQPIQQEAFHRLPAAYRLRMDRVFYGEAGAQQTPFAAALLSSASRYDAFMDLTGFGEAWRKLDKNPDGNPDEIRNRYAAVRATLNDALGQYKQAILEGGQSKLNLEKAFQSLPPSDQRDVQHELDTQLSGKRKDRAIVENPFLAFGAGQTPKAGIANIGNTCYLAAALNLLALSPYAALFTPRIADPKADLREQVHAVLATIRAGNAVGYDDVANLLAGLDHARLLEGPNAFAAGRPLNAQRDPAEVLGYLVDFFGENDPGYRLSQTHTRAIDTRQAAIVPGGNVAAYSQFDDTGKLAPVTASDWLIQLPIAGARTLQQAVSTYLAQEQIDQVSGVYGGKVHTGPGESWTVFGDEAPAVISIQLKRWSYQRGFGVVKDNTPVDMPERLVFNRFVYALQAVIYHQGAQPDEGHYTASTRNQLGGWDYRNDTNVTAQQDFQRDKNKGYLYTYVRQGAAPLPPDAALLDIGQPQAVQQQPDEGPQSGVGGLGRAPSPQGASSDSSGGTRGQPTSSAVYDAADALRGREKRLRSDRLGDRSQDDTEDKSPSPKRSRKAPDKSLTVRRPKKHLREDSSGNRVQEGRKTKSPRRRGAKKPSDELPPAINRKKRPRGEGPRRVAPDGREADVDRDREIEPSTPKRSKLDETQ